MEVFDTAERTRDRARVRSYIVASRARGVPPEFAAIFRRARSPGYRPCTARHIPAAGWCGAIPCNPCDWSSRPALLFRLVPRGRRPKLRSVSSSSRWAVACWSPGDWACLRICSQRFTKFSKSSRVQPSRFNSSGSGWSLRNSSFKCSKRQVGRLACVFQVGLLGLVGRGLPFLLRPAGSRPACRRWADPRPANRPGPADSGCWRNSPTVTAATRPGLPCPGLAPGSLDDLLCEPSPDLDPLWPVFLPASRSPPARSESSPWPDFVASVRRLRRRPCSGRRRRCPTCWPSVRPLFCRPPIDRRPRDLASSIRVRCCWAIGPRCLASRPYRRACRGAFFRAAGSWPEDWASLGGLVLFGRRRKSPCPFRRRHPCASGLDLSRADD